MEITTQELWSLLSDREQMVIRETKDGKYISGLDDVYDGLTAKGYIVPVKASMTLRPGKDYNLTVDGESLLSQAVETFEGMDLRTAAEYYKYMYESSNASHAETVGTMQAALARAQAAEGEAARLRGALEGVLMHCAKNPLDVNDTDGNRLNGVKLHTRKALGKPPFED